MNLNKLYKLQAELDKHILEKHNIEMSKGHILETRGIENNYRLNRKAL